MPHIESFLLKVLLAFKPLHLFFMLIPLFIIVFHHFLVLFNCLCYFITDIYGSLDSVQQILLMFFFHTFLFCRFSFGFSL